MTRQRVVAALLVALEAAILGYQFHEPALAGAVILLALAGASGRLQLPARRRSGLALALLLGAGAAARWAVAPPEPLPAALLQNGVGQGLAEYVLLLQTSLLFLPVEVALPSVFGIYGTLMMTFTGDVIATGPERTIYHVAALAFVFLLAAFWSTSRPTKTPRSPATGSLRPRVAGAAVLLLTLLLAVSVSRLMDVYADALNTAFNQLVLGSTEMPALGFSDQAHLGSVGGFQGTSAEATALRVRSRTCPGYLRGKTYDRLKGTRWISSAGSEPLQPLEGQRWDDGLPLFSLAPDASEPGAEPLEVTPLIDTSGVVFTSLTTHHIAADVDRFDVYSDGTVKCPTGKPPSRYELLRASHIDPYWPLPPSEAYREALLSLPEGLDPRIRDLAARLFAGKRTLAQKCDAVVGYFARNYHYHLGLTVPPGKDPLAFFLLERPAAHCEYFASGAVVLLRLGGVPCRYVTGFVAADYNPLAGTWNVRNKDAHAWVEVYDEAKGWVTIEPTVGGGLPAAPDAGLATVLGHLWEFTKDLFRRGGSSLHPRAILRAAAAGLRSAAGHPGASLGILALAGILSWGALRGRRRAARSSGKGAAQAPPELERLRRLLHSVDRRVARAGFTRAPNETLHHFALRLDASAAAQTDARRATLLRDAAGWYGRYAIARYQTPVREADVALLAGALPK